TPVRTKTIMSVEARWRRWEEQQTFITSKQSTASDLRAQLIEIVVLAGPYDYRRVLELIELKVHGDDTIVKIVCAGLAQMIFRPENKFIADRVRDHISRSHSVGRALELFVAGVPK